MADEGNVDTFEYPVNGRVLTLRKMTSGRVAVLERMWNSLNARAAASTDRDEIVELSKKMSDVVWGAVESQFINPDDLEYVQMEIVAGRLDEKALGPILANGQTRAVAADDADPAPAKRPGRKAAAAKKPAKKAAAPRAQKR